MKSKKINYITGINIFFIVFCIIFFLMPFLLVISISFTDEAILKEGYSIIPKQFSFEGYYYVFRNPQKVIDAYAVTISESFLGTFLSVLIMALCAYPLSRQNFKYRLLITFFIFFTMLFGGGLVPSYILNSRYLHLSNSFWIYIFPSLANAWYIIIMRTFFQGIPVSLVESAKLDGASETRVFFKIILPLSKPVLATVSLLVMLGKWNDWFISLVYIRNERLYTLQYLLQRVLREAEFINAIAAQSILNVNLEDFKAPTESMRFAMCIVAAGPMLIIFPFFQKYLVKGLTVGSVKG